MTIPIFSPYHSQTPADIQRDYDEARADRLRIEAEADIRGLLIQLKARAMRADAEGVFERDDHRRLIIEDCLEQWDI